MAGLRISDLEALSQSPIKRRKTEQGGVPGGPGFYGSSNVDPEVEGAEDTIETIPCNPPEGTPQRMDSQTTLLSTQPTQVMSASQRRQSIVEVAASSPFRQSEPNSPSFVADASGVHAGGRLANLMAPAGTSFRPPHELPRARPRAPVIDISDEENPKYEAEWSDDDLLIAKAADITPSTFARGREGTLVNKGSRDRVEESPGSGSNRFRQIMSSAYFNADTYKSRGQGNIGDNSRPSASNYSSSYSGAPQTKKKGATGVTTQHMKRPMQSGPARALPVVDISLQNIPDFQLRKNIERIKLVFPSLSVMQCQQILLAHGNHYERAVNAARETTKAREEVNLISDDEEQSLQESTAISKSAATTKRRVNAQSRTIQDKWSSTQNVLKPKSPISSSPIKAAVPRKRKLVQGRKAPSSPPRPPSPDTNRGSDYDSESYARVTPETDGPPDLESKVLEFFNTCSMKDLVDMANTTDEAANLVLSQRPYSTLDDVRELTLEVPTVAKTGKRRTTKRAVGDKVVDVTLETWAGYEAVDALVTRCEALGKPIAEEMQRWGFDVYGAAKNGELEITSLEARRDESSDTADSLRDSALGTPISSIVGSGDEDMEDGVKMLTNGRLAKRKAQGFIQQPDIMSKDIVMKDYQIVGLNWLSLLFSQGLSCILADDMGLGKTCQVISFLAHLYTENIRGLHLVVVPGSTLENWLGEFEKFCPTLQVEPYYGSQNERPMIREKIEANKASINVIVTTYDMAVNKIDNKFLRHLKPTVCVFDEGHNLKDGKSKRYHALIRIPAKFRLLLTGTPLQNNLQELASLLAFILPDVFNERKDDLEYVFKHKARTVDDDHGALLSAQRIARAKSMMTPFILRRKKHQVLKHLPGKHCRVEYCEMTASQYEVYAKELRQLQEAKAARAEGRKDAKNSSSNAMMALRKAAIHPLLFRRLYDDEKIKQMAKACLKEDAWRDCDAEAVYEDMSFYSDFQLHNFCRDYPATMEKYKLKGEEWMDSGKVAKLCELLRGFKKAGGRALVFSQFTMVLDILELVMDTLGMVYFRLDGQTPMQDRQDMINEFNVEADIDIFLLSTKAGGSGINLIGANKVVIFDSSFNPQEDVQAENRAHRVGQTREVEVVRLVTRGTIEEQIHALGETKLALDDRVSGSSAEPQETKEAEKRGEQLVEEMIMAEILEPIGKKKNG